MGAMRAWRARRETPRPSATRCQAAGWRGSQAGDAMQSAGSRARSPNTSHLLGSSASSAACSLQGNPAHSQRSFRLIRNLRPLTKRAVEHRCRYEIVAEAPQLLAGRLMVSDARLLRALDELCSYPMRDLQSLNQKVKTTSQPFTSKCSGEPV